MKHSTDRILTTHVGSLIRPPALQEFLRAKQGGKPYDRNAYEKCLTESVAQVVRQQAAAGVDVPSDGEFGKSISWSQYALERLSGFERRPIRNEAANPFKRGADRAKFAAFYAELDAHDGVATTTEAICVGPIRYTGQAELQRDIDNFKAALKTVKVEEAFLPVAAYLPRRHQPRHQRRGTPGTGGRAHRAPREIRRPRKHHRRHRLRLRPGAVPPPRASFGDVGKARGAGRRSPACEQGTLGLRCRLKAKATSGKRARDRHEHRAAVEWTENSV